MGREVVLPGWRLPLRARCTAFGGLHPLECRLTTLLLPTCGRPPLAHSGSDLKKRIESLIEREYLARDPNDASVYTYLA